MTTNYALAVGSTVLAGLLAFIVVFAFAFGDWWNDRQNRREAKRLSQTVPIPEVRELARLEKAS